VFGLHHVAAHQPGKGAADILKGFGADFKEDRPDPLVTRRLRRDLQKKPVAAFVLSARRRDQPADDPRAIPVGQRRIERVLVREPFAVGRDDRGNDVLLRGEVAV